MCQVAQRSRNDSVSLAEQKYWLFIGKKPKESVHGDAHSRALGCLQAEQAQPGL